MNDLDRIPSLQAFGEQLDELAERDARRARLRVFWGFARPAVRFGAGLSQLAPSVGVPPR
jgi:hypothetical protein